MRVDSLGQGLATAVQRLGACVLLRVEWLLITPDNATYLPWEGVFELKTRFRLGQTFSPTALTHAILSTSPPTQWRGVENAPSPFGQRSGGANHERARQRVALCRAPIKDPFRVSVDWIRLLDITLSTRSVRSVTLREVQGEEARGGSREHLIRFRWQECDWELLGRFGDILLIKDVSATDG
jgi:hypothetical protein